MIEKNIRWLKDGLFAHRGLHDNKSVPENSLLAFARAAEHGYGVELDVCLTKDGRLIVFHDPTLGRMCGRRGWTNSIDSSRLGEYPLLGTDQTIPLFSDVLKTIGGRIDIIVEIKTTLRVAETCRAVAAALDAYPGRWCVESFQIAVVDWWAKHRPDVILGQLYSDRAVFRRRALAAKQHEKVDFLALCIRSLPNPKFARIRADFPDKAFVAWTVRTPEQQRLALDLCDSYIFEFSEKSADYIAMPAPRDPAS